MPNKKNEEQNNGLDIVNTEEIQEMMNVLNQVGPVLGFNPKLKQD